MYMRMGRKSPRPAGKLLLLHKMKERKCVPSAGPEILGNRRLPRPPFFLSPCRASCARGEGLHVASCREREGVRRGAEQRRAMSESELQIGEEPDYEEKLDEAPKSILLGMMKQLKPGMDLSRVTLPTFILEPRSFLEKFSDFMAHSSILVGMDQITDPHERFLRVSKWFLSGWYLKPPGVKKPYNPILGEIFRGTFEHGDKGTTHFIAEQVSHHPPVSAFYFVNRKAGWSFRAVLRPKSKFLGNSAASIAEGNGVLRFTETGEEYNITFPSYYVRGLLLGTMRMEIAGDVVVSCPQLKLEMTGTFKNRGYFSGENNSVEAKISSMEKKETLYKITGRWDRELKIEDKKNKSTRLFLAVESEKAQSYTPLTVQPESQQQWYESRKLWAHVTKGIRSQNQEMAGQHKAKLEDGQRAGKKERELNGNEFKPVLFTNCDNVEDSKSLNWQFKFARDEPYAPGSPDEEAYDQTLRNIVEQHPGEIGIGQELAAELKNA